jgi:AcrR family transcriptional regulator
MEALDGRRARGLARQRTIVGAAEKLFARHGFAGVSVEQIAHAAELSGPGVYRHFSGKAEILAAVIQPAAEVLFAPMDPQGTPKEQLRAFFIRLAGGTATHGDAIALAHREWPNLPVGDRERYRKATARRVSELVALLRAWRPGIGEGDASAAVDVAISVSAHVGNPGMRGVLTDRRVRTLLPELSMAVLGGVRD